MRSKLSELREAFTGRFTAHHGFLARVLGEAVVGAARTDSFLGERYRRIARRRGKKKANVAVGRSILVIIWHLLRDETATFTDLGSTYYDTQRAICNHVHALHALGYHVDLKRPSNGSNHAVGAPVLDVGGHESGLSRGRLPV